MGREGSGQLLTVQISWLHLRGGRWRNNRCEEKNRDGKTAVWEDERGHIIWNDKTLHQNLRIRLYKASVCSVLTYGSEAWCINEAVTKKINGADANMMSVITGKTQHQEVTTK